MATSTQVQVMINRTAALRAGINGTDNPITVEIDVSTCDPWMRNEIAERFCANREGRDSVNWLSRRRGGSNHDRLTVTQPDQQGVEDAIRREEELIMQEQAAKIVKHERQRQQIIDSLKLVVGKTHTSNEYAHGQYVHVTYDCSIFDLPMDGGWINSVVARDHLDDVPGLREHSERCDKSRAEAIALAKQQILDRLASDTAAKLQERSEWIIRFGSTRLQRMQEEGIDCDKTYASEVKDQEDRQFEERLNDQRPSWEEIDDRDDWDTDVSDVPDSAIALLDAARKVAPDCVLATFSDDSYACIECFNGRWIYWPRD